jgi:hypothetical protein
LFITRRARQSFVALQHIAQAAKGKGKSDALGTYGAENCPGFGTMLKGLSREGDCL